MKHQTLTAEVGKKITPKLDEAPPTGGETAFSMLLTLSFCHLLNDMVQSLVPALYPILKENYALSFSQVGLITGLSRDWGDED